MKKLGFFLVGFMIFVFSLHLAVNHAVAKLSEDVPEEKAQVVQAKITPVSEQKKKEYKVPKIKRTKKKIRKKDVAKLDKKAKKKIEKKTENKDNKNSDSDFFEQRRKKRDEFLRKVLSEEEYKKYKEKHKDDKTVTYATEKDKKVVEHTYSGEVVFDEEGEVIPKIADTSVEYSEETKKLLKKAKKAEIEEIKRGYRKGKKIDKFLWKEAGGDVRMYDILFDVLKDENGNDRNIVQTDEELAKEMGITMKELRKLEKEGYFNNGNGANEATHGIGDGSPEDDAGMDFQ